MLKEYSARARENKKELAGRVRQLLDDFVPRAVDAALLSYRKSEDAWKDREKIIDEALKVLTKSFEFEELLFSHEDAKLRIKAALNTRVGVLK